MMDDRTLELLIDLHVRRARQGPGSDAATRRAVELAGLDRSRPLEIADLGCGTGASALLLADALDARVTAVDLSDDFLRRLDARAADAGLDDRIHTLAASIDDLPLDDERFDVLWSEGAAYNIGFERGVVDWRRLLKPGGLLVVSEICWTSARRPAAVDRFWTEAYPEIGTVSDKIAVLERSGYSPRAHFLLDPECWLEHYYEPLEASFDEFLARHPGSERAAALVASDREEIALYRRHGSHYSYGMFIAQRRDEQDDEAS